MKKQVLVLAASMVLSVPLAMADEQGDVMPMQGMNPQMMQQFMDQMLKSQQESMKGMPGMGGGMRRGN